LPHAEVEELAQVATRVRIQVKDKPEQAITSKPNAYPIEDLRAGCTIGSRRFLPKTNVGKYWESELPELLDSLWHEEIPARA